MKDTDPITKEVLIAVLTSTLVEVRPEFDDSSYNAIVKFVSELEARVEVS